MTTPREGNQKQGWTRLAHTSGEHKGFCFQPEHSQGDGWHPEAYCAPTLSQRLTPAWAFRALQADLWLFPTLQIKLLDPEGVLEEALARFTRTQEGDHDSEV